MPSPRITCTQEDLAEQLLVQAPGSASPHPPVVFLAVGVVQVCSLWVGRRGAVGVCRQPPTSAIRSGLLHVNWISRPAGCYGLLGGLSGSRALSNKHSNIDCLPVSRLWMLVNIVETLWQGDHLSCSRSKQMLPSLRSTSFMSHAT